MALIKCTECNKKFSEYAKTCSRCGCPIEIIKRNILIKKEEKYNKAINIVYKYQNIIKLKKSKKIFELLDGYKDSLYQIEKINTLLISKNKLIINKLVKMIVMMIIVLFISIIGIEIMKLVGKKVIYIDSDSSEIIYSSKILNDISININATIGEENKKFVCENGEISYYLLENKSAFFCDTYDIDGTYILSYKKDYENGITYCSIKEKPKHFELTSIHYETPIGICQGFIIIDSIMNDLKDMTIPYVDENENHFDLDKMAKQLNKKMKRNEKNIYRKIYLNEEK